MSGKDEKVTVDEAVDEIKTTIADFTKQAKTAGVEQRKDIEALKEAQTKLETLVAEGGDDSELKAQVTEIAAAIAASNDNLTKLQDATKTLAERSDKLEVAFQRPDTSMTQDETAAHTKAAKEFFLEVSRNTDIVGVDFRGVVDLDLYRGYAGDFTHYLRKGNVGMTAEMETRALQVGSDPDGGYYVTPEFLQRVVGFAFDTSPIRAVATVMNTTSESVELIVDDGEATVAWVGENETRSETATPAIRKISIPTHELHAQPRATQKLLDDSSIDVESWLAGKVSERFNRFEATAFVSGNGVARPRGFTTYASGTSFGQINQTNSGDANLLTFDGIINLIGDLKAAYKANASFLMARAAVTAILLLKDGNGQYLWRPNSTEGVPLNLLSYPVREAEDMASIAAGNEPIAFGDFRAAYTIVDRIGVRVLRDPYTAKPNVVFDTTKRVGGDVVNFDAINLQTVSA